MTLIKIASRLKGVLPLSEAQSMSLAELERLRALGWLLPMAGGDDDDSGDGDDKADGDKVGDDGGDDGDSGDDNDKADDKAEKVEVSKAEFDRLKRQTSESDKARRKAEKALEDKNREEQEEAGRFKELYEAELEKVAGLEKKIASGDRERLVMTVASRLNFRDPTDVLHRLSDDETESDATVETALAKLAKSKSYLIADGTTSKTREPSGGDDNGGVTAEQLKEMSPEQIKALPHDEVMKAMAEPSK